MSFGYDMIANIESASAAFLKTIYAFFMQTINLSLLS